MNRGIKILFIRPSKSSFIQKDLELLKKHFDVRVVDIISIRKNLKSSSAALFKMAAGILWADITFSWFADIYVLLAVRLSKTFRKKAIVVVGGYEVAKVPEIGYGSMLNPRSACIVRYVLKSADKIFAVSEFNKKEILKNINLKNINSRSIELIYNGVYNGVNHDKPTNKKEDLVITVGGINKDTIMRKGIESFVKSARFLPDVRFAVIGGWLDGSIEFLKSIAPHNVEFTGLVSDDELVQWYLKAKVYCQLSLYESFGMALAESMCFECIPVVTNNAALPEVVGDTGFYVPYGNHEATANAIKEALKSDKGKEARERVIKMFTIERREKKLVEVIRNLVDIKTLN